MPNPSKSNTPRNFPHPPRTPRPNARVNRLLAVTRELGDRVNDLHFKEPTSHVYNPLDYAWSAHERYLKRFARSRKKILFLGMNPGPWGMAQTGVPFGEVAAVRDFLGIQTSIKKPVNEHPKRRIEGFACARSEVSGRRLWGLFAERFKKADVFFADHFVTNYCPLVFMEASGRNRTPDKLPASERDPLLELCDAHLREQVVILEPDWVIGVGQFATKCATRVLGESDRDNSVQIGTILHPSPASPAANRGWAKQATVQLQKLKLWH